MTAPDRAPLCRTGCCESLFIDVIVEFKTGEHLSTIAVNQKTKLTARSDLLSRTGYNIIINVREWERGQGLAFISHHTLQGCYLRIPTPAIRWRARNIYLYIPLVTTCPVGYRPDVQRCAAQIHHDPWHFSHSNGRREVELEEQLDSLTFCTINHSWTCH